MASSIVSRWDSDQNILFTAPRAAVLWVPLSASVRLR